jgi:hypothetical protein
LNHNRLHSIGRYPYAASPFGVTDICENVAEFVADYYDESYYQNSPDRNPKGPSEGFWHVIRGKEMRAYARESEADQINPRFGFRCAFGYTNKTKTWIKMICGGDLETGAYEMMAVIAKSPPKKADGMKASIKYLINNIDGLLDSDCRSHLTPGLGKLGGIEGNVDKLMVRCLKGVGRS